MYYVTICRYFKQRDDHWPVGMPCFWRNIPGYSPLWPRPSHKKHIAARTLSLPPLPFAKLSLFKRSDHIDFFIAASILLIFHLINIFPILQLWLYYNPSDKFPVYPNPYRVSIMEFRDWLFKSPISNQAWSNG